VWHSDRASRSVLETHIYRASTVWESFTRAPIEKDVPNETSEISSKKGMVHTGIEPDYDRIAEIDHPKRTPSGDL
jgi:hypothetical protein